MELKVGDYVRTKKGNFHKITDLKPFYENDILIKEKQFVYIDNRYSGWNYAQFSELIINSSPNIIDLISYGDLIKYHFNGSDYICEVFEYKNDKFVQDYDNNLFDISEIYIKSIVTKEQFEQMEYRIGEDE